MQVPPYLSWPHAMVNARVRGSRVLAYTEDATGCVSKNLDSLQGCLSSRSTEVADAESAYTSGGRT